MNPSTTTVGTQLSQRAGVSGKAEGAACRTALMIARGLHLRDDIQDFLEYASRCALPVRDLAGGVPRDGLVVIPMANNPKGFAVIDEEDYPLVRGFRWNDFDGYARASCGQTPILMHRVVMMVGPSLVVDHRNHNTLDNRKVNLRACRQLHNMWNSRTPSTNTSGIKGVSWTAGEWQASVMCDGVRHAKSFDNVEEAGAWVRARRIELHGEFACHDDGSQYEADLSRVEEDGCFFWEMGGLHEEGASA